MTTPKIATIKRSGSRYYIHPEDGGKVPGVTSVLGMLPKGFLQYWAAKVVAEEAVRDVEALSMLVSHNPDGAIDYLKRAPMRSTRQAADDGTAAHDYFERMARGEDIRMADVVSAGGNAAVTAMVGHFADFLDVVQPEYHFLEETVWSDTHRYAGSFDAFATIDGEAAWIDNKTTRSGVHPEVGLQLAAYRHADSIIRSDGSRVPMPRADGGVVVHVRPEGWKVVPVRCGKDEFETFLHLRRVFDWDTLSRSSMVGEALHAGGDMAAPTTGPRIAAPRKAVAR